MLFLDFETDGLAYDADIYGIAIEDTELFESEPWWMPMTDQTYFIRELQHLLDSTRGPVIFHGAGFDCAHLERLGVAIPWERAHCTMLMSYMLYPLRPDGHSLAAWGQYLGEHKGEFDHKAFQLDGRTRMQKSHDPVLVEYALQDIRVTRLVWDKLVLDMQETVKLRPDFRKLYFEELQYLRFLVSCRHNGYQVDLEKLPSIKNQVAKELYDGQDALNKQFPYVPGLGKEHVYVGGGYRRKTTDALGQTHWKHTYSHCTIAETNWNSNQHKLALLERVGWSPTKKTEKGADSVDASSLEPFVEEPSPRGELCAALLRNQTLTKIYNTYLVSLEELATEGGVLRGSFNQCVTKTGRLSSSEPNLQNIPRKGELGQQVRELFIAQPGRVFCSVDLDQIEYRVLADALACEMRDFRLIKPFMDGVDVHEYNRVAWGLDSRDTCKTVAYSVIFGGGPIVCGRGDYKVGKQRLDKFHAANPNFDRWKKRVIEKARQDRGVLWSKFGRRFYLPGLLSKDEEIRSSAERSAISCRIQGTAADIFKMLTNRCYPDWKDRNIIWHGPCHDENTFSLLPENAEEDAKFIQAGLSSPHGGLLQCAVQSAYKVGANWRECH